ncbi:MAG: hypothetical protein AB2615_17895, partial [Candidatus Thiodiazotropha sp.]
CNRSLFRCFPFLEHRHRTIGLWRVFIRTLQLINGLANIAKPIYVLDSRWDVTEGGSQFKARSNPAARVRVMHAIR